MINHNTSSLDKKPRKIIHVDMDCFYAAIEIRDNPSLANKPIAVGGAPNRRGVICTCNYVARQYGIHSAMSTSTAYRHCNDLIVLPVNMPKYRQVAQQIHAIFREFTPLVEPLSLDEAYLDVTDATDYHGSATLIAKAIRQRIWGSEKLTASAGVAPNKFLAKIASGRNKPDGLLVIPPQAIENFISTLAVDDLFGVGKVTAEKLHRLGLKTCVDLQRLTLAELIEQFGKSGQRFYEQCRGIDYRAVEPNKIRKSVSVERTFVHDIADLETCLDIIKELCGQLIIRVQEYAPGRKIKNQYLKIKFSDFKRATAEMANPAIDLAHYLALFRKSCAHEKRPIRLLGLGVHFADEEGEDALQQSSLF